MNKEIIYTSVLIALLLTSIIFTLDRYMLLPIVQTSFVTGECVNVIGVGSCDDMPVKYIHEWVK